MKYYDTKEALSYFEDEANMSASFIHTNFKEARKERMEIVMEQVSEKSAEVLELQKEYLILCDMKAKDCPKGDNPIH
jgi:hypothetical protein